MPLDSHDGPEQEQSIKARGSELYARPKRTRAVLKPVDVYLRETPAAPASTGLKATLWIVGLVVALLFIAALWRLVHKRRARPTPSRPRAVALVQDRLPIAPGVVGAAESRYDLLAPFADSEIS